MSHLAAAISANYRVTVGTHEAMARVLCQFFAIPTEKVGEIARALYLGHPLYSAMLPKIFRQKRVSGGGIGVHEYHNLIPLSYRSLLAQRVAGLSSADIDSNYVAIGNGSATPSASDTTLAGELKRGLWTSRSATNNLAYLDKFF